MKLLPALSLPPVGAMDRLPLALPFSPGDLLWRYPLGFPPAPPSAPASAPPSPLLDFKNHLPSSLPSDPRVWSREDVNTFLRWCEREFDLPRFDMEMFQMNGKAICLLTKGDLAERCPGAGDVLHNVLQLLVRDAQSMQRCLPSSPVTPTSRHHPYSHPLSPHHAAAAAAASAAAAAAASAAAAGSPHSSTPTGWSLADFQAPHLAHLVHQGNSVTLSPAPSVDSQSGSPQHADHAAGSSYHSSGGSNGSNQSDTDEDSYGETNGLATNGLGAVQGSPPATPVSATAPNLPQPQSPSKEQLMAAAGGFRRIQPDFFPQDTPEPNTNGRLLWDFLQQLLNDPTQRYTNYIAWKNRETGVFKIVDPAGLAKLWGIQKNHLSMNYDKMSRALRYYYRVNILRKVQGERHCYQFLRNPSELKNIKNMSLLRQQMSPTRPPPLQQQQQQSQHLQPSHHQAPVVSQLAHPNANMTIKMEPDVDGDSPADDDGPTDLSMEHPTDLSPTRHSTTALTDCTAALLCHVVKVKPDTGTEVADEK